MSAAYEHGLAAQATELADQARELGAEVTAVLGGARNAGLDPAALSPLTGAALALGAGQLAVYRAHTAVPGAIPDDVTFLAHVADAEDDAAELRTAAARLAGKAAAALDAARDALDAADAMTASDPCDGCHDARAAAIGDARTRIAACDQTLDLLTELDRRLRYALTRLAAVPAMLGETYESVYALIRSGGRMPHEGRWITGEDPRPPLSRRGRRTGMPHVTALRAKERHP
jgi:hypothetical protein